MPHDEALAILRQLDVLVMIHPTGRRGVYTGKVFDYLASNKPILALFDPRDVVADLLAETRAASSPTTTIGRESGGRYWSATVCGATARCCPATGRRSGSTGAKTRWASC